MDRFPIVCCFALNRANKHKGKTRGRCEKQNKANLKQNGDSHRKRNYQTTEIMGDAEYVQRESGAVTFHAGNYLFTRAEARHCYRLHRNGTPLWQLVEQRHPNATVEQMIVAMQVAIMGLSFTIEQLRSMSPQIFNPEIVAVEAWNVGQPTPRSIEE